MHVTCGPSVKFRCFADPPHSQGDHDITFVAYQLAYQSCRSCWVDMGVQDLPAASSYSSYDPYGSYGSSSSRPSQSHTLPRSYTQPSQTTSRKRKAPTAGPSIVIDLTQDDSPRKRGPKQVQEAGDSEVYSEKPKKRAKKPQDEEKRMRRWRSHPPLSYLEVRDRALTQRMFALDRQRGSTLDHPTETISLAGTTGNVYTIVVDKVPSCDCPHAKKGNQCKHLAYVLSRVLRVPAELEYQLAFTSSELRLIFERAPPLPSETAEAGGDNQGGNRKPLEGECPICCVDFEPESGETILYCRAACGNNIHKTCFQQWAATKRGGNVTCPFCRAPWQGDEQDVKNVARHGKKNAEGYVNVASQLGLSGRRDYSSYHSYWVRNQAMRGNIEWDEDGVMLHDY